MATYIREWMVKYCTGHEELHKPRGAFLQNTLQGLALTLANTLFLDFRYFQQVWPLISLSEAANAEEFTNSAKDFSFAALGPALQDKWFTPIRQNSHQTLELNQNQARSYLNTSGSFLKTLLVLSHLTSGAPSRGTEINQVIWQNTAINHRNLFLDPSTKLFLIQLRYSKNFSRLGQEMRALRVLPEALSYLLLAYLLVIRPFERCLLVHLTKCLPEAEFLLFYDSRVSRAFSARVLSRSMKTLTHKGLGFRLGLHGWRHIAQGFIRYGLNEDPLAYLDNDDELDDEDLAARQMHHSRQTGLQIYGRQPVTLQNMTHDHQGSLIWFSQRWHEYIGLGPNQVMLNQLFYPQTTQAPHEPEEAAGSGSRVNTRAGFTVDSSELLPQAAAVVQFHYPKQSEATPPVETISIGEFHRYISLYRDTTPPDLLPAVNLPDSEFDEFQLLSRDARPNPARPFVNSGVLDHLIKEFMQNSQANWRTPEQRQAFHLIIRKTPYLFLVLPTGGGKTTLFLMGASLATSRTTIIISPLVALKIDLIRKAEVLGLEPVMWEESTDKTRSPRLVVVQIESLRNPRFFAFARGLVQKGHLDRIIWDECHLISLSKGYRLVMHRVKQALALPVSMIFSSATLPQYIESDLIQMLELGSLNPITKIRADLTLTNMFYGVNIMPQAAKAPDYLQQFIKTFEMQHQVTARVIIFCQLKGLVNQLGEEISQAVIFHADLPAEAKTSSITQFESGQANILIATGAIGAGFDFKLVHLVIHLHGAWSFTDFMQESGRAGRSTDQPGWSYCLVRPSDLPDRVNDSLDRGLFREYLNENVCRRRPISRVFSDQTLESCDPGWVRCDLCSARAAQHERVQEAVRKYYQNTTQDLELFAKGVQFFHEKYCLTCLIFMLGEIEKKRMKFQKNFFKHQGRDCPKEYTWKSKIQGFRQQLQPQADTCCFGCFLPTKLCKGLLANDYEEGCMAPNLLTTGAIESI
ncbi:hypothetical protein EYZ11_013212 [Aspergillus tanneri]|uniref:DNA 3'-5' helicase n=1 Tax=Aspergillus tanneri TaxID=1220188 RepID=A0A4S3IYR1_9EURO|nr:hypothetical protein EYZ11_013212 [Aspergillus tanneri]